MKRLDHWDYPTRLRYARSLFPGIAGDYSTVNQPVSQHRQELLSCRYWLSRYGFAVCWHRAEPNGQAIETIAMTMSVYLIISLTISLLMNIYNRRIAIVER